MFICGNDAAAKAEVRKVLDQFGWDIADMGSVEGPAPSSRCACSGAFRGSRRTAGRTPSTACDCTSR